MTKPRPGSDGEPLPAGTLVFRVGKRADPSPEALKQKKPPEILFKPSSDDEESPGKRLSIWVEELTLPDQGWAFTGLTHHFFRAYAPLFPAFLRVFHGN